MLINLIEQFKYSRSFDNLLATGFVVFLMIRNNKVGENNVNNSSADSLFKAILNQ